MYKLFHPEELRHLKITKSSSFSFLMAKVFANKLPSEEYKATLLSNYTVLTR